jgi:predicted nucleic acid-binding protein
MRVLVDTSVWSLSFRKKGPAAHPSVAKLRALLEAHEDVVLTGLILQEILQAFRSDTAFQSVAAALDAFPLLPLERDDCIGAAALHRRCAAAGVSASTADCQIAVAAIHHGCLLLTADEDFRRMTSLSALRLA